MPKLTEIEMCSRIFGQRQRCLKTLTKLFEFEFRKRQRR